MGACWTTVGASWDPCCWGWASPVGCSYVAKWWVDICACIAWWTCQGVHVFLLNLLSFLAFHRYHKVIRILWNKLWGMEVGNIVCRIACTPSCSCGMWSVLIGGSLENHTARGSWQWKYKCASSSIYPHTEQCAWMWTLYLATLCPVARALLIKHQVKVLISGGNSLLLHAFCKIRLACGEILLDPCWGSCISSYWLRCL